MLSGLLHSFVGYRVIIYRVFRFEPRINDKPSVSFLNGKTFHSENRVRDALNNSDITEFCLSEISVRTCRPQRKLRLVNCFKPRRSINPTSSFP